ncbi:MAG TPA: helix-turn-helix domain-containing protein [Verrucomicrobiae bacterium]|nr:helix-turn-helix domain-containing protein [Verrucomicrobiae bacterium]
MVSHQAFGAYLRECRLKVGYGLRSFAEAIEMQPSNLSNIEHGRMTPPQDPTTLARIADTLGLPEGSKERTRLFDLAVAHKQPALPPDVAAFAARTPGIPVLLRTIENKRLTREELTILTDYINQHLRKPKR